MLGPQSETVFLISLLHQIDFSETTYQEDSETPSKIRLSLFLQRLEKNQDSVAFLENFEEVIEDLALSRNITKLEGFHLLLACLKLSLKLQILILFSLMFQEQHSPNPEILSLFQEKLRNMLSQPEPLKNILIQPQILEFLQTSPFFESLRIEFKDNFPISPLFSDDLRLEFDVYEDNPKLKKFHNLDFCLKPHELLQEYTGNPLEITNIFPKNIYNEEEILSCIGSFAKTYPFLEDSCQRDINKVFETHLSSLTTKISSEKTLEKKTVNCNLETFLKGFSEFPIKWPMILQKLDRKSLHSIYKDQKSLTNFLKLIQRLRKMYNLPFPASFLFSKWINIHSQIYFLHNLFQIGVPDLISWSELSQKHIISLDFNPALRYQTLNPASLQFWCCLELLELLIEGSETEYYFHIRNLFEIPLAKCPDILIIGLSQIKPKAGMVLLEELFSNLFPLYLLNHSNSIPILEALWRYNEKLMIEAIFCLYRKENSSLNLSRVLDITQEIKDSLIPLANCSNLIFSVSLGILASKREFLHFEHWLTDRLKNVGNSFITILLRYIEENVILPCDMIEKAELIQPHIVNSAPQNTPLSILEKAQMTLESLGIIMENFLGSGFEKLHPKNQKKAKEIFASVCKYFPALSGMNESAFLEIETAANNLFHKVLSKEMKVEEFVDVLQKLKGSSNPSDKEIYACMVRYLFDEFRHHEEYNQDTLNLTGEIFGRLINTKF